MAAQGATKILGQEIIPVNKPGGTGAVAAGILANSKGDGYTLLASVSSAFTCIPHLEPVAYDPFKDIIPIIQFGSLTNGIIVRSDSPFKFFKDLIDFARKNPGKVSYGVPGIWIPPHLAMEQVMLEEKVNLAIIPFGGAAPTITALLGGHVSACGVTTSGFLPHLKAGKVKVLVVVANKRIDSISDVPTVIELGYLNSLFTEIYLISAPKGTPTAVLKKLEGAFLKAMETPEFRTLAETLYLYEEKPLTGQKLKEYIEGGYAKNGEVIRKAKLSK
jgi:tripartite-type tricarboxylate transporter receptor subunit TctC